MKTKAPYFFDEFFASGLEESVSPFLTKTSRNWGKNLPLKSSIASAVFYLLSFIFSFVQPELSYFFITFVYFLSGIPAIDQTMTDLRNLEININLLMILGAFISLAIGSYLEGAFLLVLFHLSGALEQSILQKAVSTLQHLHKVTPKKVLVLSDENTTYEKAAEEIPTGTLLLVRPGEVIPLDAIVIEGDSYLNLSHLTGESKPIAIGQGYEAPAGAQNGSGRLIIKVIRTSSDSTLTKLIQLITKAQKAKPRLQRWLELFSRRYAKTILFLTGMITLLLPLIFSIPFSGVEGSIYRALTFLIAASPCALLIGTPVAYMAAISSCAKQGIILKGGVTLDAINSCKKIAMDKTGTITTGRMRLEEILFLSANSKSLSPKEVLQLVASLEQNMTHPLSESLIEEAKSQGLDLLSTKDIDVKPGHGLSGKVFLNAKTPKEVFIGNLPYLSAHLPKAQYQVAQTKKKELSSQGKHLSFGLIDGELFYLLFSDPLRHEAKKTITLLKKDFHLQTVILSGDQMTTAEKVGKEVGIDEVHGNLTPEEKLRLISEMSKKEAVAMVGDGMNDAPSLARSTVGIAMGKVGSSSAIFASDAVLMKDDLRGVYYLFSKAKQTERIVKQNLFLALSVICFATIPAVLGILPLWLAIVLHEGGTLAVALNGLRLLKKSQPI